MQQRQHIQTPITGCCSMAPLVLRLEPFQKEASARETARNVITRQRTRVGLTSGLLSRTRALIQVSGTVATARCFFSQVINSRRELSVANRRPSPDNNWRWLLGSPANCTPSVVRSGPTDNTFTIDSALLCTSRTPQVGLSFRWWLSASGCRVAGVLPGHCERERKRARAATIIAVPRAGNEQQRKLTSPSPPTLGTHLRSGAPKIARYKIDLDEPMR